MGAHFRPLVLPATAPTDGPLVSIVIPAYNMSAFAGECIDSAINQTYRNLEIVVVDDCSTEPTADVFEARAASDDRVRVYRNKANLGVPTNLIRATSLSRGPLVKFLNADDVLEPDCVARLVSAIESDPATVLAFSNVRQIDRSSRIIPEDCSRLDGDTVVEGRHLGCMETDSSSIVGPPTAVLIRRNVLGTAVAFGDEFQDSLRSQGIDSTGPLDIAWYLKILSQGDAAYLHDPLARIRRHVGSRSWSVARDPEWWSAFPTLFTMSRSLGFFEDPASEAPAWVNYVDQLMTIAPLLSSDSPQKFARLFGSVITAFDRIAEIERQIGRDLLLEVSAPQHTEIARTHAARRDLLCRYLESLAVTQRP